MSTDLLPFPAKGAAILFLPGGAPECVTAAALMKAMGATPVGASVEADDPARDLYEAWHFLPLVTDPAFADAFARLAAAHDLRAIYTRNEIVFRALETFLSARFPQIHLIGLPPERHRQIVMETLEQRTPDAGPGWAAAIATRPALPPLRRTALLKGMLSIDGQMNEAKLWALAEIARSAPAGDVVEIGSAWGRSSYVLGRLSGLYGLGALLSIDPWSHGHARQADSPAQLAAATDAMDIDRLHREFIVNMAGHFDGNVNFLRLTSMDAIDVYRSGQPVRSDVFGETRYTGSIGILHIDGNHDLDAVEQDMRDWLPHLLPGGWLVVDDYDWAFGDGPRIAGDRFLKDEAVRIACHGVAGGALFVKLKG